MPTIEFGNKTFLVDEEGFLLQFSDWCQEWVEYIRISQDLGDLTDNHWILIRILQDYYKENGTVPMARFMSKSTGFKMKHIYELFPTGPGKGACKMAGLPKPKGCV